MAYIRFFVVLALFSGLATTSWAETYLCRTLFPEGGDIHLQASSDFRVIPNQPFLSFRGSVAHFWKWIASLKQKYSDKVHKLTWGPFRNKVAKLLSHIGYVVGDFHTGNWGDIELINGRKTGLIDMDDVGVKGPLLGDYIRGAVGVHLSGIQIPQNLLWTAYVQGLQGVRYEKPERLIKAQKKSDETFEARQAAYLQEITNGGDHFVASSGIIPIQEAPFLARQLYKSLKEDMHFYFSDYVILDVGFRMKMIGGSQRLPRFWFLLKDPTTGEKRVAEAKYLVKPGTSEFAEQGTAAHRIEIAGNAYRPSEVAIGFFDVLEISGHEFQIRERYDNFLNFDPLKMKEKLSQEELEKTLLYVFNQLGRFQARQPVSRKLLATINENQALSELVVLSLMQNYLEIVSEAIGFDVAKLPSHDSPSNESNQTPARQSVLNKAY